MILLWNTVVNYIQLFTNYRLRWYVRKKCYVQETSQQWNSELVPCTRMYCLQWLIPVLLLPKPVNPAFLYNHAMFVILYLLGFVLERRPCAICSLVFAAAVFLICYSWSSHCVVWPCEPSEAPLSDHWHGDSICGHTETWSSVCKW